MECVERTALSPKPSVQRLREGHEPAQCSFNDPFNTLKNDGAALPHSPAPVNSASASACFTGAPAE
jgi:hypothetical protein